MYCALVLQCIIERYMHNCISFSSGWLLLSLEDCFEAWVRHLYIIFLSLSFFLYSIVKWSSVSSFSSNKRQHRKLWIYLCVSIMHNVLKLTFALFFVSWLQRASCQSLWTPDRQLESPQWEESSQQELPVSSSSV